MKTKLIKLGVLALSINCSLAQAISINTIINVLDDEKGTFTVSNNDGYRQFINVSIADVNVVDGKLVETPYTKDNIDDWSLEATPSRLIVEDNQRKKFSVKYVGEPNIDQDKVYSVTVAPSPYFKGGEIPKQSVQIAVGFAPYVIVPAKEDQPLSYSFKHNGDSLSIKNNGNSYLHVTMDGCDDAIKGKARVECLKTSYALSGRELTVNLTDKMKDNIKVSLKTNNSKYRAKFDIKAGESKVR